LHVKAVLLYSDFYIEYRIRDWQVGWRLVIMSEFDVAQMIDRKGICPAWSCGSELRMGSGIDPGSLWKMAAKMERGEYIPKQFTLLPV